MHFLLLIGMSIYIYCNDTVEMVYLSLWYWNDKKKNAAKIVINLIFSNLLKEIFEKIFTIII